MPSQPRSDPDVTYVADARVVAPPEVLAQWVVEVRDGSPSSTHGPCPECTHYVESVALPQEIVSDAAGPGAPPRQRSTRKIWCACKEHHESRPADLGQGCGRWFLAALEPEPGGGWRLSVDADESMIGVLDRQEELRAGGRPARTGGPGAGSGDPAGTGDPAGAGDELSRARASAEKWLPGIAGLYGLFGLAGVAVGRDAVASLPGPARLAVVALVALGLVCTVLAVVSGYTAAFGWFRAHDVSSDEGAREHDAKLQRRAAAATRHLRTSVVAALAALTCLLATLFVLWLAPPAKPVVEVSYTADASGTATACGALSRLTSETLTLTVRTDSGTTPLRIPTSSIERTSAKARCS